ncbi:DUF3500 domain-containing protein [Kribbella monticola]|uniref:DUF3500 domain-containing protein n=1 Tax=Kribbella monticola TaxID=2185285 RepID=UPI000DD30143|nr:DUF3500 domain-containing protein [Kribbella monticola]
MVVEQTRAAALELLAALSPSQRSEISASFDIPDHQVWTYLPGDRPGVTLAELDAAQRALAMRLLEIGCSERGYGDTQSVLFTEAVRRGLAQAEPGSAVDVGSEQRYYLRILGDPAGDGPWAWRINGHHLAVHVTVVDGVVAFTPQFFGAEPAVVESGPHKGFRALPAEQDLGFELLHALEPGQRAVAVFSEKAPDDILTRYDPVADPGVLRRGLAYGDMDAAQQTLFSRLIGQYVGRAADVIGQRTWKDITDHGIERLTFSWAGASEPGAGHYYSLAGPTFLAEYDNTQNDANHIHSVWRDLHNDWGKDLLAEHYASHR